MAGLVLAWVTTGQVVRPIGQLTEASQRIAAGVLTTPIPHRGQDEVGTLGQAMESMRAQLQDSLERIENWNRELEQRVRERTQELERLYQEVQRREAERGLLLEKIIGAQEEERKRVARDLHDEVAQALTGLGMGLARAQELVPQDPPLAKEELDALRAMVRAMMEEVRRMIVELRPSLLDDLGLEAAVTWYAETRLAEAGTRVTCQIKGLQTRLPPQVETALFRVVQEAVNNIAKHAHAKEAQIFLERSDARVVGRIEDNGVGFETAQVLGAKGRGNAVGLAGMEERITLLGGSLRIASHPGAGTRIAFEIPVSLEGTD